MISGSLGDAVALPEERRLLIASLTVRCPQSAQDCFRAAGTGLRTLLSRACKERVVHCACLVRSTQGTGRRRQRCTGRQP